MEWAWRGGVGLGVCLGSRMERPRWPERLRAGVIVHVVTLCCQSSLPSEHASSGGLPGGFHSPAKTMLCQMGLEAICTPD